MGTSTSTTGSLTPLPMSRSASVVPKTMMSTYAQTARKTIWRAATFSEALLAAARSGFGSAAGEDGSTCRGPSARPARRGEDAPSSPAVHAPPAQLPACEDLFPRATFPDRNPSRPVGMIHSTGSGLRAGAARQLLLGQTATAKVAGCAGHYRATADRLTCAAKDQSRQAVSTVHKSRLAVAVLTAVHELVAPWGRPGEPVRRVLPRNGAALVAEGPCLGALKQGHRGLARQPSLAQALLGEFDR